MDEYTETAAPLGSAEAAVLSCVRLISAVTCQPEKLCAYYLDLYYQVRRAYERENEPEKPEALTLEECWPRLRELIEEKLRGAAGEILTEMGLRPGDEYPALPRTMNRRRPWLPPPLKRSPSPNRRKRLEEAEKMRRCALKGCARWRPPGRLPKRWTGRVRRTRMPWLPPRRGGSGSAFSRHGRKATRRQRNF